MNKKGTTFYMFWKKIKYSIKKQKKVFNQKAKEKVFNQKAYRI